MLIMDEDVEYSRVGNRPLWGTTGHSVIGSAALLSIKAVSLSPDELIGALALLPAAFVTFWQGITALDSYFFICNGGNWSSHQHSLGCTEEMHVPRPPSHPEILIQLVYGGPRPQYF